MKHLLFSAVTIGWLAAGAMLIVPVAMTQAQELGQAATPKLATKNLPYINTLGMKLVPVKDTSVLFCSWETRVADFAEFVQETGYEHAKGTLPLTLTDGWSEVEGSGWDAPGFEQTDAHPVTCVSWEDAKAFCKWLSEREGHTYRLPTDAEWSAAIGIAAFEDAEAQPAAKAIALDDPAYKAPAELKRYPWGQEETPTKGAGNFAGQEVKGQEGLMWPDYETVLALYRDAHPRTAPVGSYEPDPVTGLYDLAGNVWEWCEDWYDADAEGDSEPPGRVLRGSSWATGLPEELRTWSRAMDYPESRSSQIGFRVVLVLE